MNLRRLFHTTAIRLSLRYALFYALLITLGFGALYVMTRRFVDVQSAKDLNREIASLVKIDQEHGRARLIDSIASKSAGVDNQRSFLLQSPAGAKLAGDLMSWPAGLAANNRVSNIWVDKSLLPWQTDDDDELWPMVATRLSDSSRLLVAERLEQTEDVLEFILETMVVILAIAIILALAMGLMLGRTVLQRIDVINATAQRIMGGDLSQRLPPSGKNDEFDELGDYLNAMLARIEQLLSGMREVTDNVAHDLRMPLARMRSRIEVTLMESRKLPEYHRVLEETLEDANQLMQTFNALLEIAQMEAGSFRGEWELLDFSRLVAELSQLYSDVAEERAKYVEFQIEPNLKLNGNRHLLAQAVSNLLDNAVKHTAAGCAILVNVARVDGGIVLSVSDNGEGIPSDQRDNVLQRFVRLEKSRSTAGNGLGLSLVKAVADLHNAALELADNRPGLRITLWFEARAD
jgi:signal transduction histidine kinase